MREWTFNKITCSYWTYIESEDIWITGEPTPGDYIWVTDTFQYRYLVV